MAIELHHLQPSHDNELSILKARIAELESLNHDLCERVTENERMNVRIAELEEERRWRKFPDEKPNWGEEVIVTDDASKQFIVRFSYDMKWISFGNMHTCESKYVKYWMPLPSAPKEDK
ncbi:hypothetical protein [Fibrobacter sp. UWH4]|uniref:hypothetical protein n=1 Tax=Fibrobacter sp. UWH4 TaxID=1896210 RepID=UPI0009196D2C|nr:hypothetical protein [Fibrobacter sp. UWH4]SHL06240.1 hypothetical protein SAMN05720762_10488 [Fibrobacter sp. UWH4]